MTSLFTLYISFFQVGLFSVGGGLAALPLIQEQVIEINKWLSLAEFTDLVTIAQMTPGPIALNASTFVGTRIAGLSGAIVATLGAISPSIIIVSILAYIYFKYKNLDIIRGILEGLRPAAVALIASAGLSIFIMAMWGGHGFSLDLRYFNYFSFTLFLVALYILRKYKMNPIAIMLTCGMLGGLFYYFVPGAL